MSTVQSTNDLFAMLIQAKPPIDFPEGTVIFTKGDEGDTMYIVAEGSVTLSNGERTVGKVTAPGLFGELALIDGSLRSLSAVADANTKLVVLPNNLFWILIHDTPYFSKLVLTTMAERLRDHDEATT